MVLVFVVKRYKCMRRNPDETTRGLYSLTKLDDDADDGDDALLT